MEDFLDASERTLIQQDVRDLTMDPELGGTILYRSFVSRGTFDPNTGGVVSVFAGTWTYTYRMAIGEEEITASGGYYQHGDYRYYFSPMDIGLPKKDDRIIDGPHTRYVVGFSTDSVQAFHVVVVRNLGA